MSQDKGNSKGRRNHGHSHNKNRKQINVGDKGREVLAKINENSPVIKQFQEYAVELDAKHDRYERLIKISRDITIESKRIIFLLHTLDKESKKNAVLGEAEKRLNNLITVLFKNIAQELDGEDSYHYLRAYRAGLQEFVEAITFYWFLQNSTLYNLKKLEESFNYTINISKPTETEKNEKTVEANESDQTNQIEITEVTNDSDQPIEQKTIRFLMPPADYILGIADLTGELMRKCINNLTSGDISSCYQTCNFVRSMYKGFLGCVGISGREVARKLYTLRQSLIKMENVCYTIKVRGSEIPKHMLADVATIAAEDVNIEDDEGYQVY
ncbi:translin-associated protein X [Nasonia vitripennis]|uniref:Translin-associated protein X n=1 Tax=Nasonia vitripennis TaxID=7425 RepID=A0A7M7GDN6_NASVI|nr:translin-associated protein X [Nasonia vitripennis]